jgi:hypothetical protein
MTTNPTKDAEAKLLPPYVSFQSVKTALAQFKEHATPDRIDRSVLTNFSGAIGGQILTAFRFLGLTDANGHSTDALRELVKAFGTDAWPEALTQILKKAYAPIFALNLASCSPSQFMEKFKGTYQGADDVIRKSITFFLNAASDAKIPVSAFIMKARKPRSGPTKKRPPRVNGGAQQQAELREEEPDAEEEVETPPASLLAPEFMKQLLEKFPTFDPAWPENVQSKWFDAFEQLMSRVEQVRDKK